jgi:tagaturonate reductase
MENHNTFCNSLVDRIVPGKPSADETKKIEASLGYQDELMTKSEVFRLWAIEGDEKVKETLSFYKIDESVVITPDISLFKELKLRLLNGTHTFNCGLAFLSGFKITREAMADPVYGKFTKEIMQIEIAKAIPYDIDDAVKKDFANKVFERFCNPFIEHQWQSITVQYVSKMKMRNIPLLQRHYDLFDSVPVRMATGFAGMLQYLRIVKKENGKYFGERNGELYEIKDESAEYFYQVNMDNSIENAAVIVMQNKELWGTDLTKLPGFLQAVQEQLNEFAAEGVLNTIARIETKKEVA